MYDDLEGVTRAMATKMARTLQDGLDQKLPPKEVAKNLAKDVTGIGKERAELIARTEIVRGHAEGQLDFLQSQGVEAVEASVEFRTAGDGKVCPICRQLNGKVYSTQAARGLIPIHPRCRCAWLPSFRKPTVNVFCPTGKGGGVNPTCSLGGKPPKPAGKDYNPKVRIRPTKNRAFLGDPVVTKMKLGKQEAGKVGEDIVIQYLRSKGRKDAGPMNLDRNNFPIDLLQDSEVIEAKTGQAWVGRGAQQWRLTIGEPGDKEKAALKKMTKEEKAAWNLEKQKAIHRRKAQVIDELSDKLGKKVKAATYTVIINPDTRTADLYRFAGFHDRIGWNSDQAKAGYIGSVTYERV